MALNTLDYIKGSRPVLSIGTYVAAGGAGSLTDVGTISDVNVNYDATYKDVESDSSYFALDTYATKVAVSIEFTAHEAQLTLLAKAMGLAPSSAVATVARVGGATDGTQTMLVGDLPAVQYYQATLLIDNQSMLHAIGGADAYTKRTYTFWRTVPVAKIKKSYKRDDHVKYKVELKVYYDSSVSTADKLFKVVDFLAK